MLNKILAQLKKRGLSLLWRAGVFVAVGVVAALVEPEFLNSLGLPAYVITGVALIGGEITKFLNNLRKGEI